MRTEGRKSFSRGLSSGGVRLVVLGWIGAAGLLAQEAPLPTGAIGIDLTKDSPLALVRMDPDRSSVTPRGAAVVLDLHIGFTLRNDNPKRIHGVMLRVVSQEATPGGRGSVTYPSLNVGPGEVFQVRIDTQLVRPTPVATGPLVQVDLDGVLYQDLSFYGPDRLHSKRYLTACDLEAQRDREHFKRVFAQAGKEGLRQEILQSTARQHQVDAAPLNVRVVRSGPAVTSAAMPPEHPEKFQSKTAIRTAETLSPKFSNNSFLIFSPSEKKIHLLGGPSASPYRAWSLTCRPWPSR